MVGLWIIAYVCCAIEPSLVKGRGKISAKLPEIWDEVVKMPHEEGCPLHMISKMDEDNSLRDVRVEIFKEEFLRKLGLKEHPNLAGSDSMVHESGTQNNLFHRALNISSIHPNEVNVDGEKAIVMPKGFSMLEGKLNVLMDLPAHLISDELKSAELWVYPNQSIKEDHLPKIAMVTSEICRSTKKPSWPTPNSISITDGWLQVDLTSLVKAQLEYQELCYNVTIEYKPENIWVHNSSSPEISEHKPFLLVRTESSSEPNRDKRNTNCGHNSTDCCRENLTISFSEINWSHWIIHPLTYNAYYCKGSCSRAASITLNTYYTLTEKRKQLLNEKGRKNLNVKPCCVPTKFSPLSVVYKIDKNTVVTKIVPDMVIERCGCM